MPSKNALPMSAGFVRVTMSAISVPMIMAWGTSILRIGARFVAPKSKMTMGSVGINAYR